MRQVALYRYSIPMQSGLVLRDHTLDLREGLLICLIEKGKKGWGEIAPLPSFSKENLNEAQEQISQWLNNWQKRIKFDINQLFPSVAFGCSMALMELEGKLGKESRYLTIPLCSNADSITLHRLKSNKTTLAKLKIGRFSPEQDAQNVKQLVNQIDGLKLRLDANRAWDLAKALSFAEQLSPYEKSQIQFIEEPCFNNTESLRFAHQANINIAWDETVQSPDFQLQKIEKLSAVIIKPTLIGSIEKCKQLIQKARQLGIESVISSSIESSLTLNQLARFATQFTPNTPAGLDTLALMNYQLIQPFSDSKLPLLKINSSQVKQIL